MAKKKTVRRTRAKSRGAKSANTKASSSTKLDHRPYAYNRPLLMLPFDHRASFSRDLLGVTGEPNPEQVKKVMELKRIVYDAFVAVAAEQPDHASYAILVDETYGSGILREARHEGYTVAAPAEKSGQEEFQFDVKEWKRAIDRVNPTIVKALVRYNPLGNSAMNRRQRMRLKQLSDYCHKHGRLFLFELLVPPTPEQKKRLTQERFDATLRPALAVKTVQEIQRSVHVDIWKIEALPRETWHAIARASEAQASHTKPVFIMLGRNASIEQAESWLTDAAPERAVVGFAVGRTVFAEPLERYVKGNLSAIAARHQIAMRFRHFVKTWKELKKIHYRE